MMRKLLAVTCVMLICLLAAGAPEARAAGAPGGGKKGGRGAANGGARPKRGKGGKAKGAAPAPAPATPPDATPGAAPAPTPPAAPDDMTALASGVVEFLRTKQLDPIFQTFDPTMQQNLPADKLNIIWNSLVAQCGPFKEIGAVRPLKTEQYDIRFVTCKFEKITLEAQVVFNAEKKISGLFFNPVKPVQTPLPAAASEFNSVAVTVGSAPWELPGTLTLPKGSGPFPAVVLVHGSGPNDRDETIGANKPFRDLAEGLAAKGIAVLRYEKRTRQHALACAGAEKPITVKEETIDDAVAAVAVLRQNSRIDPQRIFVAGHSLGGMLIPCIAACDSKIAGFIVMAGAARPLEDLVLEQSTYLVSLAGAPTPAAQKDLADLKRQVAMVKALQSGTPKTVPFILGASPEYWLALKGYDPAESAKGIAKPILVLQGGRDYQVSLEDFKRWQTALSGKPTATCKLYPDLNHLFMTGTGKSTPAEYDRAGCVAQPVIDDLAAWVGQVK